MSDVTALNPEDLEVAKPRVVVNTNVEINYAPRKLAVRDKEGRWVALIKREGRGVEVSVWRKNEAGELDELVCTKLGNVVDILGLEIPEEVKSAIGFALSNWDKEIRKQEAMIALSNVPVIPDKVTDRELLAYEIANEIISKYRATSLKYDLKGSIEDAGIYCYDRAWYYCGDRLEEWVSAALQRLQKVRFSKNMMDEVESRIRILNPKTVKVGKDVLLSFENGVLDVECFISSGDLRGCVKPHDPDLYVFHHIPHQLNLELLEEVRKELELYIPPRNGAEVLNILKGLAPKVYEYLKSLTYFENIDPDLHDSRTLFILEMIGRGLIPGYSLFGSVVGTFKNIFVVVGPRNTGKSTMLHNFYGDLILSERNYSLINLGKLGSTEPDEVEKEAGKLYKKNPLVAMHLDLGKNVRIRDWSFIRQVSGGDPIPARRLYRDSFDYSPAWKIYISTNDPPPITETGYAKEALLGRFKAIELRNVFRDELNIEHLFSERDVEATIITALYAVKLVYDRKEYSFTGIKDTEDLLNRYTYPEYRCVIEMIEVGWLELKPTLEILSSDLYRECVAYVDELKKKVSEEDMEEFNRRYSLPDQRQFTINLKKLLTKYGVKPSLKGPYTNFKGIGVKRSIVGRSLNDYEEKA